MKRFRRWLLVLSGLSILVVGVVVRLGAGHRWEFCPATLEHRGVTVYTVPYTNVEVWTNPGEPYRPRIVQFWYDEGYARAGNPPGRWHVITSRVAWNQRSGSGWARGFWHYSGCQREEVADEWIAWSRRHPALAADLWPRVVARLHRAGAEPMPDDEPYWEAAMLMLTVWGAEDEPTYRERIATWERRCAQARAR